MKTLKALLAVAAGAWLIYSIKKRKFRRTNKYGKEEFDSYAGQATTTTLEGWGMKLGIALIVIGGLLAI